VWQLVNFSWRGRSDPGEAIGTYVCGDLVFNVNRYCAETVERLVVGANREVDPVARADRLNRADEQYLEDLAVIPLYQKPNVMAWNRSIEGPAPNYSTSGDLWNLETWTGKESIVVALPAGPLDLSPFAGDDPNTNTVLGPVLYGAFGMDPALSYSPMLLESVDVVEG
jgi:ABC-type transport system substrate-binding protein